MTNKGNSSGASDNKDPLPQADLNTIAVDLRLGRVQEVVAENSEAIKDLPKISPTEDN